MDCGLGFWDLVHNYGHLITSVLHNFGSALYVISLRNNIVYLAKNIIMLQIENISKIIFFELY